MKRIDIVVGAEKIDELVDILLENKIRGYSIIRRISGLGARGHRTPEDVLNEEENILVFLVCENDTAKALVESLQPKLKGFGGVCIVSNCLWVEGAAVVSY
ncbi:nitrogen regulatory protein P-II family [Nitrosomonas nitrosa]|uniref:P-II family nitrogen regulator n=1 Tax=Nitrosomonas nitrosa TaxID=52442 RepID=UPI000D4930F4|nr:transcriptional regulator [Nitrosomonas nitrosa]PTQ98775.1 nitrogen regulatory protein P-II family [Nitrosomonas nitrosa]